MRMHSISIPLGLSLAITTLATPALAADVPDDPQRRQHALTIETQRDNADNDNFLGAAHFALGEHLSLSAGLGSATSTDLNGDPLQLDVANAGLGLAWQHLELAINYQHRQDAEVYNFTDYSGAATWRHGRFGFGVDLLRRRANSNTQVTINQPNVGPVTVALNESVDGHGWGLHGDIALTERLQLSAGAMKFGYDSGSNGSVVNSNRPLLSRALLQVNSGINREQAILDRSFGLDLAYRRDRLAWALQYFNDKAFQTGEITQTLQLTADVFIGSHWTVSPMLGSASADVAGTVAFAGLSTQYAW